MTTPIREVMEAIARKSVPMRTSASTEGNPASNYARRVPRFSSTSMSRMGGCITSRGTTERQRAALKFAG